MIVTPLKYDVAVLGLGYVGLTLACVIAKTGFRVTGVDVNEEVVSSLQNGIPHFHETGLTELLNTVSGTVSFSTTLPKVIAHKKRFYIIAVGTSISETHEPDYGALDSVSRTIGEALVPGDVVVLRSTVIIGTTRNRVIPILEEISGLKAGVDFSVSFAPERTIEGKAIAELYTLPQIIGGVSPVCTEVTSELFSYFTAKNISIDSLESAEMVKLASNAYRDMTFAFANALALISAEHNIDVNEMINAANDGYERNRIPKPSPGVGGYCLTKDPYLLSQSHQKADLVSEFLSMGRTINDVMTQHVAEMAETYIHQHAVKSPRVLIAGLAFKGEPDTSDVRFSPSELVIKHLQKIPNIAVSGYDAFVHDEVYEKWGIQKNEFDRSNSNEFDIIIVMHTQSMLESEMRALLQSQKTTCLCIDPWAILRDSIKLNVNVKYSTLSYKSY